MSRRSFYFALAITFAYIAYLFAGSATQQEKTTIQQSRKWSGKNNTILLLTNSEHGQANVLLATSHALLMEHNDLYIHFVSFEKLKNDIETISRFAAQNSKSQKGITFHQLKGRSLAKALNDKGFDIDAAINAPGIRGFGSLCRNLELWLMPWMEPEYIDIYREISEILEEVDSVMVAVDPLFGPGLDSIRAQGRNQAILSPNSLKENFVQLQPWGAALWKYPE